MMSYLLKRPRRLRQNHAIRNFVKQFSIPYDQLVLPLFIRYGQGEPISISSMPGHSQIRLQHLPETIEYLHHIGLKAVILFGIPEQKDPHGTWGAMDEGIIQQAIRIIKKIAPDMIVMADTCLCEYTDHGHCGVIDSDQILSQNVQVLNDPSIHLLAQQALSYAKAGADIIAPSACMDGMIYAIRSTLDEHNFQNTIVLSYSVKYASHLYGPFRQAAEGAPQFGDRKTYQMDYRTARDAILEAELDVEEGADMLMVKPGHTYLDIIYQIKQKFPELPLGAYHTSGEFAMIKAGAEKGYLNERLTVHEIITALHRAGSDFILTYYAKELLEWRMEN
jgi:porphobilinogen synthase